jgi:hypothetical protein
MGAGLNIKSIAIVALVASPLALGSQAQADGVLYTNGPVNGTYGGDTINDGYAISDSFILTQTSTITGVNFGAWTYPGVSISTIQYGIATTPGVFPVAGTSAVTQGAIIPGTGYGGEFEVRIDSFSTPNITLGPGTYYLVLQGAETNGDLAYWDLNFGPSSAVWYSSPISQPPIPSESFDILGVAPVPLHPLPLLGQMLLLGLGGFGLLAYRRRQSRETGL